MNQELSKNAFDLLMRIYATADQIIRPIAQIPLKNSYYSLAHNFTFIIAWKNYAAGAWSSLIPPEKEIIHALTPFLDAAIMELLSEEYLIRSNDAELIYRLSVKGQYYAREHCMDSSKLSLFVEAECEFNYRLMGKPSVASLLTHQEEMMRDVVKIILAVRQGIIENPFQLILKEPHYFLGRC